MTLTNVFVAAAIVLVCCFFEQPSKGEPVSDKPESAGVADGVNKDDSICLAIAAVKQARRFETDVVGEGSPSRVYPHYRTLCTLAGVRDDQLWEVVNAGTPAGRLYAASALYKRNAAEGKKAFERLVNEKDAVQFQSGCEVFNATVSEIASALLKNGIYMDFSLKKTR